ncbi:polyphosphate kinase 2 [Rubellicoccus peritrichatus]|uniref:ADP/GDP-polyphosphate phosphotransferase n=2 Tax=Rubellicoccus peritrichatus TaxID=3080537 RepID=A0AAQ3QUJ5_9BACT|nr:polyphosphate kinase 2 [Puniceicoccus sp. CR14]WOO39990.1 polyphosphate kinase 2 [Puniceicoccus sp. CR14]
MCANTNSQTPSDDQPDGADSQGNLDDKKPETIKDYYSEKNHEAYKKLHSEIMDDLEEEMELDLEDLFDEQVKRDGGRTDFDTEDYKRFRRFYFKELRRLQIELVRMQDWVQETGYKLAVIFEGRDAAGKGGVIKRFMQRLNPRICRTVALPAPSDREKTQWYFQRYVPHLPAGGEIVLFDRSWYNRAGVESVMGFATPEQVDQFFNDVPLFEQLLVNSGIKLVKYWFSIEDEEQEWRFQSRILDPLKQWKLSPMDLESRIRWEDYTKAKELNFQMTNFPYARWNVVQANDKKTARLNCIRHLLSQVPYKQIEHEKIVLPSRVHHEDYVRTPVPDEMKVPNYYTDI